AELILAIATNWPAGLIVMGSRSRGHMTRLFMGSVSQEVVLQAPCPVEVIK
ncbi:MAG: universal stress protein, partial [Cyanobacteria bacterium SZAS TMP-1]|nr:universal stress protein [Cyanobacteria bacterium SZAS TMP-1]